MEGTLQLFFLYTDEHNAMDLDEDVEERLKADSAIVDVMNTGSMPAVTVEGTSLEAFNSLILTMAEEGVHSDKDIQV